MIKVGIIGAGRIGHVHGESISKFVKNATVKAIADPFMNEKIEAWAKSIGVETITKDYHDILSDPEIEAVLICASTDQHAPVSIEALRAGKHVFCEKPIDHDVEKIKEVLAVVKETGKKYQVGFNRRFDHNFRAIHEAVKAGKVGKQQIIKITSRDPEPPPISYVKVSGGIFMDMTIHDFDMVRYLTASDVVEVFANGAVLVDPLIGKAGDIDTAIISLKMANGALAVIDNSRKAVYGYDQRAEVFGSKGQASVSNDTNSSLILSSETGIHTEKPLYFFLERYMASFTKEVRMFVQAIEQDSPVPVDINDGLQPVLIAAAALRSLKEHRPVLLSEIK